MSKYIIFFIFVLSFQFSKQCVAGENNCYRCHPFKDSCLKCSKDVFKLNDKGVCVGAEQCQNGDNYCDECDSKNKRCEKCDKGYYPDSNGGCANTENCKISFNGECLECEEDHILIGEDFHLKYCKNIYSNGLKNCEQINKKSGNCEKCKEGYYLTYGYKCTETYLCQKSILGICQYCYQDYYLDKRDDTCKKQEGKLEKCKITIDGKNCDECDDNFYLAKDGNCVSTNHCQKKGNGIYYCEQCTDGYLLSKNSICVKTENCDQADNIINFCTSCNNNYYLDLKDGLCKLNIEENEYKFCKIVNEDGDCTKCENGDYFLGKNLRCTDTENCENSKNGVCIECITDYYLGLDGHCSNDTYCAYSNNHGKCFECKDNYYFSESNNKCLKAEGKLLNCKTTDSNNNCAKCRDGFYLDNTEKVCYSNEEEGAFYKCDQFDNKQKKCIRCIDNYYLGEEDRKCTKIKGCAISENENKCIECSSFYCLDQKKGTCIFNQDEPTKEEEIIYFNCNKTNEDGTACEECLEDYEIINGVCVNMNRCEKTEDDTCVKCKDLSENDRPMCLNPVLGCVEIYVNNCAKCDNEIKLDECNKCNPGYELDEYGDCYEEEAF